MKKKLIIGLFFAGAMTLMFSACSNDDDASSGSNVDVQELTSISTSGTWRVSLYEEDNESELYHFSSFTFTFNEDGSIVAENGLSTYTGTWQISNSSSSDDDNSSDEDFIIVFNDVPVDSEFEDINDDWDIVNYSETTITLTDVSGGDGSVDNLVFTKN